MPKDPTHTPPAGKAPQPDTEVLSKPRRRLFSGEYKLRILEEADRSTAAGEIGALLRREGLYSSQLTDWRRARKQGALGALAQSRGAKRRRDHVSSVGYERLRDENAKLRRRLDQAEAIIEVQKKVAAMLEIPLPGLEESK